MTTITVSSNFHAQTATIREDVRAGDTAEEAYTRLQARAAEGDPAARRKLARIRKSICGSNECQCIYRARFGGE